MIGYRASLAWILQIAATPYGLALSTWGSGAAVQHFRGNPQLWEIFLFAAGGMAGYLLATLPVLHELRETGSTDPGAQMAMTGMLQLAAIAAAIGAATLVAKIAAWVAWPLGGFAAILVYLLLAALLRLLTARRA